MQEQSLESLYIRLRREQKERFLRNLKPRDQGYIEALEYSIERDALRYRDKVQPYDPWDIDY